MPTEIEIIEDRASVTPSDQGFLKVHRLRLRLLRDGAPPGEVIAYDCVDRDALDAVLIVLYAEREGAPGDPWVCVRSAVRPPLALRPSRWLPVPDARPGVELWELPAGLIEPGERGEEGVRACASRETEEETGLRVAPEAFEALGVPVFLSPGLCAEKLHVLAAKVQDREAAAPPVGDGALEQGARVEWWPLSECLQRAGEGVLEDAKTELALHRLRARESARRP